LNSLEPKIQALSAAFVLVFKHTSKAFVLAVNIPKLYLNLPRNIF